MINALDCCLGSRTKNLHRPQYSGWRQGGDFQQEEGCPLHGEKHKWQSNKCEHPGFDTRVERFHSKKEISSYNYKRNQNRYLMGPLSFSFRSQMHLALWRCHLWLHPVPSNRPCCLQRSATSWTTGWTRPSLCGKVQQNIFVITLLTLCFFLLLFAQILTKKWLESVCLHRFGLSD